MNAYRQRPVMAGVAMPRASSQHARRAGAALATGEGAPGSIGLGVLLVWMTLFGAALDVLIGWPPKFPALPSAWPTWSTIEVWLGSAILPTEWLIPAVGMVAWVLWGWTCLFVVLRIILNTLEAATRGAAWVRSLRHVSNLLMIPAVRHAVDASLAGLILARVATVPAIASAQAEVPFAVVMFHGAERPDADRAPIMDCLNGSMAADLAPETASDPGQTDEVIHTVRAGETWASIARQHFGSEDLAEQLLDANVGRPQRSGLPITRRGLIHEGQTVWIPATLGATEKSDGNRSITVEAGDTLWGIAARDLGDGEGWRDIYELSKGAVAPDGHVLRDPNLIWSGLVVKEPTQELSNDQPPADPSAGNESASLTGQPSAEEATPEPAQKVSIAGATALPATPAPTAVAQITSEPVSSDSSRDRSLPLTSPPASQPVQDAAPEAAPTQAQHAALPPVVGAGIGAGMGLAGLAGGALVLRRRHPRSRRTRSESDDQVRAGFAEIKPTNAVGQEPLADELDTASWIAARLSGALATVLRGEAAESTGDLPTPGTALAGVRHGRSSTTLMLQGVPIAVRGRLIASLPEAASRAFGERSDVEGMVSRDGDVLVRLSDVADHSQVPGPANGVDEVGLWDEPSPLLRLGLLADGQVFAANWDALGHILVAAPLAQGAEAVLGGLLAGLVAKRSPAQLGLLVIGSRRSLSDELLDLPHLLDALVDPHDEQAALDALMSIRRELEQRMSSDRTEGPHVVLVLTELGQLSTEHMAALGSIMLHGPRYRLRVLAASSRRAVDLAQHCPVLPEFGTRLVLRTPDEEESIALLGSVDATELGPGGHLLARLEGRVPLQAHGYRAAPDRLARLVGAIRVKATPVDWWQPQQVNDEPERELETGSVVPAETKLEPDPTGAVERQLGTLAEQHDHADSEEPPVHVDDRELSDKPVIGGGDERDLELMRAASEAEAPQAPDPHQLELLEALGSRSNGVNATPPADHASSPGTPAIGGSRTGRRAEASPRPRLRGRFLGARELLYDGEVVWPMPGEPDESAMELLVFLAVQDPSGVRAELLGDSFWEEDDDDARADRLKKRRYRLRLALKRFVPGLVGDPLARMDKQHPVHRLNSTVIESDVHRFLKLVEEAKCLAPNDAIATYEEALELYRGDLLDRPDVPPYRWLDEGPRLVDLRVKYAAMRHHVRRRLADLLATGTDEQLARAEELYIVLAGEDPLDHRLWEALAMLHGRRNDLLGLEATMRRLRSALVELGEGEDPERVPVPPALAHVFADVRATLLNGRVT